MSSCCRGRRRQRLTCNPHGAPAWHFRAVRDSRCGRAGRNIAPLMRLLIRLLLAGVFVFAGLAPALGCGSGGSGRRRRRQRAAGAAGAGLPDRRRRERARASSSSSRSTTPGLPVGDPAALFAAIEASARPVTAWVGPSGAQAFGGAAHLLELAAYTGAAPGAEVGYLVPTVVGRPERRSVRALEDPIARAGSTTTFVVVSEPIEGLVDEVVPTIGQFLASLNGRLLATASGPVTVETTELTTADDGSEIVVASVDVRFLKPGLLTRFLRLAMRPEAMFFFLTVGLAAAAFEFYAAGVGITAGVAILLLFLAGFGIASLPMNWLSLALVFAEWGCTPSTSRTRPSAGGALWARPSCWAGDSRSRRRRRSSGRGGGRSCSRSSVSLRSTWLR